MIPPLCGDGMAMALRAAEICTPLAHAFLSEQISLSEWETGYRAAWQAEFRRPVQVGRWLQAIITRPRLTAPLITLGRLLPQLTSALVHATRGAMRT